MNRPVRCMIGCFAMALLLIACSFSVLAEGSVTYRGNAGEFIFSPGSRYSPTDLFADLKGLMPGDTCTQKVTIFNKANKKVKIRVYLRSLGAQSGSEALLSQLDLTVRYAGNQEMAPMFAASAAETAQLSDWVCLGTIYSGGKIDLDVILHVPASLGNEFQDAIGFLNWEFRVEELPVSGDDPQVPATGDHFAVVHFAVLALISGTAAFTTALLKRKADRLRSAK